MATIKDVAKMAGVSVTTVSIVLNGKAEERKISPATQERIQEVMRELGYQPNLTARRLRSQDSKKPVIAFFWPLDYRTSILASFLNALQLEIRHQDFDCELVIQTYENDKLNEYDSIIVKNGYSGIIVGACSRKDLEYLENLSLQMPLVLINRNSEHFSTVCTDTDAIGLLAATQIRQKGYTEAAVFASSHTYMATGLRTQAFLNACTQLGITILPEHLLKAPSTLNGGFELGNTYCQLKNAPRVIFCDTDCLAIGALSAFSQNKRSIPDDIEILTIAMLDPENTKYSVPPLSVIEMPTMEMCQSIIQILKEKISTNNLEPSHVKLDAALILRSSF